MWSDQNKILWNIFLLPVTLACASLAVPCESVARVTVTHEARLDSDKPWHLVDATLGTAML